MLSKEYGGHGRALKEYSLEKPVSTVVLKMCERKEKSEQFGFGIFSKELFFFLRIYLIRSTGIRKEEIKNKRHCFL